MTLFELFDRIVRTPNRQMAWGRVPVIGSQAAQPFEENNDYIVVRLASMFLKNSRVLWLKLSPLVHATVDLVGRRAPHSEAAVIGPAQFGELAVAAADRTVVLHQKLAGPAVWRGGDLNFAAGLFAVPKDKAAAQLLDTLGQLSALGVPGLDQALKIGAIVKSGVEGLIGLDDTKPVMGVKIALKDSKANPPVDERAVPCVLAGISAPAAEIDFTKLWVREGRLHQGKTSAALSPFEKYDHILIAIERGAPRQDWRGLPALTPHEQAFDKVLREIGVERKDAEKRVNDAFAAFDADLSAEDKLTDPDKERVRGEVIAELKTRVDRKYSGLFGTVERRSVGGVEREIQVANFDFLGVGDAGPESAARLKAGARPF